MRIGFVGVVVTLSMCVMPFAASAHSACVRPWAIVDKWIDNHDETEPIDQTWTPDDTFETVDAQGNPLLDADVYNPLVIQRIQDFLPPRISVAACG
jgi:hypothetical protein